MKLENRIAMISRSKDVYSETFIRAQRDGLKGQIYFYYGTPFPVDLEGYGKLYTKGLYLKKRLQKILGNANLSTDEMALAQSFKKNKIQVVLAQYGTTAHAVLGVCKHLKIPLITHFHGFDASVHSVIERHNFYKQVFDYSSFVIAVSDVMYHKLLKFGCPENKLIRNTYGPNPIFFQVEPKFSESCFLGLGRFVDKKAPYYTILAFKKVHTEYPEAKLVIGGTGELFESCQNLIKALHLEQAVLLPGILDQEQFLGYLSTSMAFVQHSITPKSGDQEGTPLAVLEASASGIPVIGTHHAGIPDVIINGETGYVVPEHDIEGMAQHMLSLLKNKPLAKELGAKGRERILQHFTLKRYLDVLDELIQKVSTQND